MTTLEQLSERITLQPLHARMAAALARVAGADVRKPESSPERRTWANGVLADPFAAADARVMNLLLTNPTVSGQLDQAPDGSSTPDSDLEYVPAVEILPLIAPE